MLYRTHHHHFLFPLYPFTSTSLSPHPQSTSPSSSPSLQGMESVEGALKGSFKPDMGFKTNPYYHYRGHQAFFDDIPAANCQNGALGDDFFVEDLLDFSNAPADDPEEQKQPEALDNTATATATVTTVSNVCSSAVSLKDDFGCLPSSELSVPADDLESLEWLSHFVEDSFSEYSLTCPATKLPPEPAKVAPEPEAPVVIIKPCLIATPVHTKARTKRARTGVRVWSLGSTSPTSSSSSSTSSSSSMTSTPSNPWLAYSSPSQTHTAESLLGKQPAKKQKKKTATESSGGGCQQPRRCSHCGVQKTPQWRAGPLGAKTLCNACGVRFKSGRLLPEYRPACSPTFSSELHSNNHRKVLEMRRQKENDSGLAPPLQSF